MYMYPLMGLGQTNTRESTEIPRIKIHGTYKNQQQRQCTVRSFFSSNQRHNKQTQLIINAVGTDRLGIVHDMTKEVIDAGGNVGASQAAKLGEYFSLMMLVEVPESKIESLKESLSQMQDLSASVCSTKENEGATTFASSSSYTIGYKGELTLEGADNPGIVHKVTKILSTNGLNIDKMETTDELAPGGGAGKIFCLVLMAG